MLIYGKNPVRDLFDFDKKQIKKIYIEKKRHQSFYNELQDSNIKLLDFKDFRFNEEVSYKDNTQGIIALIEEPKNYSIKELIESNKQITRPVIVMLDRIEDPQNFGAIIRNATAFGVNGIIYPSRNSARLNSTAMKTSAGTWIHTKFSEVSNLSNAIAELKKNDYWIVSTSLDANATLDEIKEFDKPLVILLGNEGKGVKKSLQAEADFNIKIEMSDKVESLNVSSAAAIILHYLK